MGATGGSRRPVSFLFLPRLSASTWRWRLVLGHWEGAFDIWGLGGLLSASPWAWCMAFLPLFAGYTTAFFSCLPNLFSLVVKNLPPFFFLHICLVPCSERGFVDTRFKGGRNSRGGGTHLPASDVGFSSLLFTDYVGVGLQRWFLDTISFFFLNTFSLFVYINHVDDIPTEGKAGYIPRGFGRRDIDGWGKSKRGGCLESKESWLIRRRGGGYRWCEEVVRLF